MRTYLNAGFGSLIGAADLELIKSLGFAGVRQDVRSVQDARPLAQELADAGMVAILVLDPAVWNGGDVTATARATEAICSTGLEAALELGNELDGAVDPRNYALAFARAERAIRSVYDEAVVLTAGIRSTRRECLDWLRTVIATGQISERACVGYHTYRSTAPGVPCEGYAFREDEYDALRDAARGRRLWMTEIGWSTAPRKSGGLAGCLGRTWRYSDGEVADFLDYELRLNRDQGSESFVVFQLNDAVADVNEGRFGIRTLAGDLKPSAHVVGRYA